MKSGTLHAAVIQAMALLTVFCMVADAEPDDADVLRMVAANPHERKLADGLLKLGSGEMRKKYDDPDHTIEHFDHSRLDAWLSRGSLDTELAASRSPKALLAHLKKSGIHHDASVAAEFWMLREFSHVYRDQLRLRNERDFPRAGILARSIRDALNAANNHIHFMCSERSYAADMIWGQSEWLLHQAKPGFIATGAAHETGSTTLWATLRAELWNCRDREGRLAREDLQHHGVHGADPDKLESCLNEIRQALEPWNTEGRDYLLTELILLARDNHFYFYGGAEIPRVASLIHTRRGPMCKDEGMGGPVEKTTGQMMVTLSSGRREIWDADRSCAMPKVSWGDVAWITNVRQQDTHATADQRLRVVCSKGSFKIKPRGGWIQEFGSFVHDGVTIVSIDRTGETWLEHYDFTTKTIRESYRKSAPKPDPYPDWASPFMRLWP